MDILGSIGQLYTFVLLAILFLGCGLAVWAVINTVYKNKGKINTTLNSLNSKIQNNKIIGGINMKGNGFIKLAVFSFVGILISGVILTAIPSTTNSMQYNMNGMNMQSTTSTSSQGSMNMQSGNSSSIQQQLNQMQQQLNQMQQQINNNSMNSGSMSNSSNMNNSSNSNMSNMNSNSSSNSGSSSSGSSMSSMGMM